MLILDTHIWIWMINNDDSLSKTHKEAIKQNINNFGLSIISLWEVAKLVEVERLKLDRPVKNWIEDALQNIKINILPLNIDIIVNSTQLKGDFHKDPADQIIVSTAIYHNSYLITADLKILNYPYVKVIKPS